MKRNIPPLNALKAFESAARNLNFSKAAQELFVTQGAVSKQIKILEDYCGKALFERGSRSLKLTQEAQEYYSNISVVLDAIDVATNRVSAQQTMREDNIITVNSFASFGTYWLIPRLEKFKKKNPDIHVYITTGYGSEINMEKTDCDIAIWGYKHSFKGAKHQKLLEEEMVLVGAKSLISGEIKTLSDLTKYPFLKNNYRPEVLNNWIKSVKIKKKLIKNNLSFDYLYMLIEAAKQGLGLAFIPRIFVKDLIKSGALINPLQIKYKTNFAYYLVYNEGKKSDKIKKFNDWLIAEVKSDLA